MTIEKTDHSFTVPWSDYYAYDLVRATQRVCRKSPKSDIDFII